jgi:integrin alpha FG-GAP repeat containing protein 1
MNLHIIYNQFSTDPSTPCKLFSTEVDGVYGSPFAKEAYNMKLEDWTADNLTITQITAMNSSHMNSSRLFSPNPLRPPRIRLGDINVDGYVDIVMVVTDPADPENADSPQYGSVFLGMNNKRGGGMIFNITETSDSSFAPYFQANVNTTANSNNLTALSSFKALSVSFFDFDEKGSLGLWVSTYDEESQKSSLIGLYNFVSTSNYILKALTLNGNNHELDDVTKKLGGIYHGSSIECIVNDVNGKARIAKATQLAQTGYTALELPYAFIGLGRTNNYVQDFYIGITQNLLDGVDLQKQSWTPIIPNSQLIVNTVIDGDWTLDVYVSPMSQTWLVALITIVILIILAIVIFILHLRERSEDKKKEERIIVFA